MKRTFSALLALIMALSLCAFGSGSAKASSTSDDSPQIKRISDDLIEFENVILVDDDTLTMELVNFYAEDWNWAEGSQSEKHITVKVKNKTAQEFFLNPDQFYLDDEAALILCVDGSIAPAPGKSMKCSFMVAYDTKPEHKALGSLDELFGLEGSFYGILSSNDGNWLNNKSFTVDFSIPDVLTDAAGDDSEDENAQMKQQYAAVIQQLAEETWFFNGGSNTTLNGITFTEDAATITQVYFDGNGKHESGSFKYSYRIDDENITVILKDGSELVIPYVAGEDGLKLGDHEYFTTSEVDAGLQGYWKVRTSSFGTNEHHIYFNNGTVQSESASEARGRTKGEYYYYGPYKGTYTLNFGGLDTDMSHGHEWFFNIIDGTVTVLHYDHICSPSSGFPGEHGYSF